MFESTPAPDSAASRDEAAAAVTAGELQRRTALVASIGIVLALLMTGFSIGSGPVWAPNFWGGALLASGAGFLFWRLANYRWRRCVLNILGPVVAARVGDMDFVLSPRSMSLDEILKGNRGNITAPGAPSWQCAGTYRGNAFRLQEITSLTRPGRVHGGMRHKLIVRIAVPEAFDGILQLHSRAAGLFGFTLQTGAGNGAQIRMDAPIDACFDIWSTSEELARALLTANVQEALIFIRERHPDITLTGRFADGWFALELPVATLALEDAKVTTPLPQVAGKSDRLQWELTLPHRLIDALMGDLPERLR